MFNISELWTEVNTKNILNDKPKHELERNFEISDQRSLKLSLLKIGQMSETLCFFTKFIARKDQTHVDCRGTPLS